MDSANPWEILGWDVSPLKAFALGDGHPASIRYFWGMTGMTGMTIP